MSTATLTKKELFVQGSLTTDVAEMIEILAVNVPGVKSCNVNAVNKSLSKFEKQVLDRFY